MFYDLLMLRYIKYNNIPFFKYLLQLQFQTYIKHNIIDTRISR